MELERNTLRQPFYKNKKIILPITAIILAIIFYSVGYSSAKTKIDGKKTSYDQVVSKFKSKESKLKNIDEKIDAAGIKLADVESQIQDKQDEYDAALTSIAKKAQAEQKLKDINSQISGRKSEVTKLNKQIDAKHNELATATSQVKAAKGKPKFLSAGKFEVGRDLPEGRYKVSANGGEGNFFVNQGADVNIILGNGDFGESEYMWDAYEGDEIELTTSAKFTPVE
ncbi:hypothetical protein ACN6MY_06395 [Peribacillus sp. B-H-3]|uniref:hypothetical protein n=1 Tax=Peribacillus sp. B-H-3 TaxID=3400420 RepID=UPI003B025729